MTALRFSLDTPLLRSAASIVKALRGHGFAAYFVGGCVRDLFMGEMPKDIDIATNATPDVIQEIFPNTVAVGEQFGVVIAIHEGIRFEIATFRSDAGYRDGRHPDSVRYSMTPEEDARRRDFTINALFYDPLEERLLDFHGGQRDIEQKVIRAIGNARERFREDRLRMMRAVRFAARFESGIESGTRQAIIDAASEINQVSAERLHDELTRILTEGHSHPGFVLLDELGLLQVLLPELIAMKGVDQPPEFHPEGDVWVHTLLLLKRMDETKEVLGVRGQEIGGRGHPVACDRGLELKSEAGSRRREARGQKPEAKGRMISFNTDNRHLTTDNLPPPPDTRHPAPGPSLPWRLDPATYPSTILAWGALLHDVGKPATFRRAPDRIRFDGHMDLGAKISRQIGRRLRMSNEEGEAIAELVLDHLKFKDAQKMRPATLKRFVRREHFAEHLELHRLDCLACHGNLDGYNYTRDFVQSLKPEEARPKPILTGDDLIDLGYTPGPEFKKILTALEDAQLENQITDRESAMEYLRQKFPPAREI